MRIASARTVSLGAGSHRVEAAMEMGIKKLSHQGFDATVARVPDALKSEGFGVLTQIDVAATLKAKIGADFRRYTIFGACNPPLALEALTANLDVGTMLPCNVAVYERDDGDTQIVAVDPLETAAMDDPRLAHVAKTVHEKLTRVLASLAG
jgi:uncharacterized protein (DUF302 family)